MDLIQALAAELGKDPRGSLVYIYYITDFFRNQQ